VEALHEARNVNVENVMDEKVQSHSDIGPTFTFNLKIYINITFQDVLNISA
jgi:hypothetical protein